MIEPRQKALLPLFVALTATKSHQASGTILISSYNVGAQSSAHHNRMQREAQPFANARGAAECTSSALSYSSRPSRPRSQVETRRSGHGAFPSATSQRWSDLPAPTFQRWRAIATTCIEAAYARCWQSCHRASQTPRWQALGCIRIGALPWMLTCRHRRGRAVGSWRLAQ